MSSTVVHINLIIQQMNAYLGLFILTTGIIGSLLNIIIFTSLKTFRQTSAGFYLTVTSIFNLGQGIFALTTRILDSGFALNLTNLPWSCKLRTFLAQSCVLLSLTAMSLATIDQFLSMTIYRQWSTPTSAHRHILIACAVWFSHGVFALIYWDTPFGVCTNIGSAGYRRYLSSFYLPVLLGCLPIVVMVTFSLLAYVKIRTLGSREMNVIRLSRDRQLTAMTLMQVAFTVLVSVPYTVFNIYDLNSVRIDREEVARYRLIGTVVVLLYYGNFAVSDVTEQDVNEECLIILESILYFLLCIQTLSTTIALCTF